METIRSGSRTSTRGYHQPVLTMKLKNIFYSITHNKCPKCHTGNVFLTNNPYNLKQFDKMNKACNCCGEVFDKEPGYFYGAMYVSYGLMVAWFVFTWAIDTFIVKSETWQYLTFLIISIVTFMPLTFRTSRLIWINLFVRYDEEKNKIAQKG